MTDVVVSELRVPPDAYEYGGTEILRAFIVDGGLHISLIRAFEDSETWGILLVDIARHAARIFSRETGIAEDDALQNIRQIFDAEWDRPTDWGTTNARS